MARVPSENARLYKHLAGVRERWRLSGAENVQGPEQLDLLEVLHAYQVDTGLGGLLGTKQLH